MNIIFFAIVAIAFVTAGVRQINWALPAGDGKSPLATGADDGGASPAHVLAPPRPPMMRAHPPALPLSIRAVP